MAKYTLKILRCSQLMTFKANNWTKYQQLDACKNCDIKLGPINNK